VVLTVKGELTAQRSHLRILIQERIKIVTLRLHAVADDRVVKVHVRDEVINLFTRQCSVQPLTRRQIRSLPIWMPAPFQSLQSSEDKVGEVGAFKHERGVVEGPPILLWVQIAVWR